MSLAERWPSASATLFRSWKLSSLKNYAVLIALTLFALAPLYALVVNSFKSRVQIAFSPFGLPTRWLFSNFNIAWERGQFATTLPNSVILAAATIFFVLLFAGLAGFALARLRLRGANYITFYFLVAIAVPPQFYMVPLFFLWRALGMLNTFHGMIIIYVAIFSPFAIYLLRSYMVSIPEEFVDAARIDGAGNWQVFRRLILPLSWPGFLTAGLVVGLSVWNEFLFAQTFMPRPELNTVATSLAAFQQRGGRQWGLTNAASVIMVTPVIVLFLVLQRRFIHGLTQGGLKA